MVMAVTTDFSTYNSNVMGADSYLRGKDASSDLDDITLQFENFKFKLCKSTMTSCAETMREDKVCNIEGRCDAFRKGVIIPIRHAFCSFASDQCADQDVENLLNRLYKVGAITDDIDLSKKIDQDISELNDIKHKLKMVKYASEAEKAKKAKQEYLDAAKLEGEVSDKMKEKSSIDTNIKKVETEVAVV